MAGREKIVSEIAELLQKAPGDYSSIDQELRDKRLKWWQKNKNKLHLKGSLPKQAYQLLLLKLEISPKEAPIVYEDKNKIIFHSFNFCPVLEACQRLGLDTRVVCKQGYEQSVQDLIACLDRRLKFFRNYHKIRPYTDYCEEIIVLKEK